MPWLALTVKPQHEKAVEKQLAARALEAYAPVYKSRRRWSDRERTLELPLFPNYVFCRFSFAERVKVMSAPGVRSIVSFAGKPAEISDREINAIRTMADSGCAVQPWAFLTAGDRVRVSRGPLTGLEGLVVREKTSCRIVVRIDALQRAVAVELDQELVEPLARSQSAG